MNQDHDENEDFPTTQAISQKDLPVEEDYDPHLFRKVNYPLSGWQAVVIIVKSCIGPGFTVIPYMFKSCGMFTGIVAMFVIGFLMAWVTHTIVRTQYLLCKRYKRPYLSYSKSMRAALLIGPRTLQPLEKVVPAFANILIIGDQFTYSMVYIMFLAKRLEFFLSFYFNGEIGVRIIDGELRSIPEELIVVLLLIPLILISLVKTLKLLVPLLVIALILNYYVYFGLLYGMVLHIPCESRKLYGMVAESLVASGLAINVIFVFGVVMTVERNLKYPKSFCATYGIVNVSLVIVVVTVTTYGIIGYWRYGESINISVQETMARETKDNSFGLTATIAVAYIIGTYFTYGLQLHVGLDILWKIYLYPQLARYSNTIIYELGIRCFVVICLGFLGVFVPYVRIICSTCMSLPAFFLIGCFPALMILGTHWENGFKNMKCALIKVVFLLFLSFYFGISRAMFGLSDYILK